jgi:quinol monooxygenase YgiN
MIGFYTKFITAEADRDALIELLSTAAASMDSTEGSQIYIVNQDMKETGAIWVTEIWDSSEAHAASLQGEGAKELIGKAMPLLIARPLQIQLVPIVGKGL